MILKKHIISITICMILTLLLIGNDRDQSQQSQIKRGEAKMTAEAAVDAINRLLPETHRLVKAKQYQKAHDNIEEMIRISHRQGFLKSFIYKMMDYRVYTLQLMKRFDEALKSAYELQTYSDRIGRKKSPWNQMKIADCYIGKGELGKGLDWIEKAVYERGFIKYKFLLKQAQYKIYDQNPRFNKMIRHIKTRVGIGQPAKDFTTTLLDGKKYTLSARKGKVVLIDFWEVTCPPCVKAFPKLQKLHEKYRDKGLEIIGISLDTDQKELAQFLDKAKPSWKIACSYRGWKDEIVKQYGISATPSTWLIDRQGILREFNLNDEEMDKTIASLIRE